MSFTELQSVVLLEDVPAHGLRSGDAGVVVHVYSPEEVEVEFLRLSGHTQSVLSLATTVLRAASDDDVVAVRSRAGAGE